MRLLVVEDDPDIVELISHYLEGDGFRVEGLGNGNEALRRLKDESFDLLILDLGLPGMDPLAEEAMLWRDIQLVKKTRVRYHAQHLSTAGAMDLIRCARQESLPVTCEVTPHHLLLTDESVERGIARPTSPYAAMPGHQATAGTRTPPSRTSPLAPRSHE